VPLTGQVHARIIDQVRLVDDDEGARLRAHGQGRLYAVEQAHGRGRVQHLGAVQARPVRRDPPRLRIIGQHELRQLVLQLEEAQRRLLRHLVAEADAVIERAEDHVEGPTAATGLDHAHADLVVLVPNPSHFAPRLRPRLVPARRRDAGDVQAVKKRRRAAELEAEQRLCDDRPRVTRDAVVDAAVPAVDLRLVAAVRRGDPDRLLCGGRAGKNGGGQRDDRGQADRGGAV
jgi:hypothetical protein